MQLPKGYLCMYEWGIAGDCDERAWICHGEVKLNPVKPRATS
jgi:hypothetical protein